ncbi:SDR family NAD(P)-dependent oxidoreductase [Acrocarpospora sp. B8E8]|uniref:SDR family NAD(P)-dependent oxidoreductase n=1 Tax=Acrocarpospora sp. B8E8 TaxID=3153572 RepID=UPI00325E2C00
MRLTDKIAIVTGAASGIGAATAERFAAEGAVVYAADIAADPRDDGRTFYRRLDVADLDSWGTLVAEIADRHGRIDVLFNCAGFVGSYDSLTEIDLDDWHRIVAVNQTGVFYGMRSVIPVMRQARAGAVVNMSSAWGLIGSAGVSAYQAAKGAVTVMTKNAAMSYAADGIRVNSVHPGLITTPMTDAQDPEISAELVRQTPLGRAGRADEVASAALFLASDEASFITGAQLVVDGGLIVH